MTYAEWKFINVSYDYQKDIRNKAREDGQILRSLNDLSFNQLYGEVVGIVGSKGSGKTTLVKLLAGEYEPSIGKVIGRDKNFYRILLPDRRSEDKTGESYTRQRLIKAGIERKQLDVKLSAILLFSELGGLFKEKLRNYTVEEKVQLELSIMLHAMPAIIYIDESLLTVREDFYIKFFLALVELKALGTSIWIETENLKNVANYCDKVLWLEFGKLKKHGPTAEVLGAYEVYYQNIEKLSVHDQKNFWKKGYNNQLQHIVRTPKITENVTGDQTSLDQQETIILSDEIVQKVIEESRYQASPLADPLSRSAQRNKSQRRERKPQKKRRNGSLWLVFLVGIVVIVGVVAALSYPSKKAEAPSSPKVVSNFMASSAPASTTSQSQAKSQETTVSTTISSVTEESVEKIEEPKDTYTVKTGETLSELAERFNVTISQLREWNGLSGDEVRLGEVLNIKEPEKKNEEPPLNVSTITHRVLAGESLTEIAEKYSVTVGDLKKVNGLSDMTIYSGSTLALPDYAIKVNEVILESSTPVISKPDPEPVPEIKEHIVSKGETLYAISRKYNVGVMDLQAKNRLQSEELYLGQVILIP